MSKYTLHGADGRVETSDTMPASLFLPGDVLVGEEGIRIWDGRTWVAWSPTEPPPDIVAISYEGINDDAILAGLMRRILDDDSEVYTDLRNGDDLVIDGHVYLTDAEAEAIRRAMP